MSDGIREKTINITEVGGLPVTAVNGAIPVTEYAAGVLTTINVSSTNLAAGASVTLGFAAIPNGKTDKFLQLDFGANVPLRTEVFVRPTGAAATSKGVHYSQQGQTTVIDYERSGLVQSSTGTADFQLVLKNLDKNTAADVYANAQLRRYDT